MYIYNTVTVNFRCSVNGYNGRTCPLYPFSELINKLQEICNSVRIVSDTGPDLEGWYCARLSHFYRIAGGCLALFIDGSTIMGTLGGCDCVFF